MRQETAVPVSRHVLRHEGATPMMVRCPRCGDVIVHNGNYFCNSVTVIAYDRELGDLVIRRGTCTWALPERPRSRRDREVEAALTREVTRRLVKRGARATG